MFRRFVLLLAFVPSAALAEGEKPQAPTVTPTICKTICSKGRGAPLSTPEKDVYLQCFIQSMCKADIISPPVAKTMDSPLKAIERLIRAFEPNEVKG